MTEKGGPLPLGDSPPHQPFLDALHATQAESPTDAPVTDAVELEQALSNLRAGLIVTYSWGGRAKVREILVAALAEGLDVMIGDDHDGMAFDLVPCSPGERGSVPGALGFHPIE